MAKMLSFNINLGLFVISIVSILLHFFLGAWPLILAIIVAGIPLLLDILKSAFKGDYGADILALMAVLVATYLGEYLAATIIISMLSSGQILESYSLKKASFALRALSERMPLVAHKKVQDNIIDIELVQVALGDQLVIFPHEICPVDGIVLEGYGHMDESYLTGEPYKVSKAPGVAVLSGAVNGPSMLVIEAQKLAQDSRYAKIMQVMEDAEQKRPKMRRLADQLGAFFAPLSFAFALLAWYLSGDISRFLSVLVIATPCPLLIAIPVAIISAISLASKRGIIIKDPIILERLPTCRTAIFDKTGTLTYGQAELTDIQVLNDFSKKDLIEWAASVERYSKHPLAIALCRYAKKLGIGFADVQKVSEEPGKGITGVINNKTITITDRKNIGFSLPAPKHGLECIILVDNNLAAICSFQDTLRAEGTDFVRHLLPMHKFQKILIVSGDRREEVEYLAKKLGIKECYSSQTPEQKVQIVKDETKKAPTLFMGDGINDAPALAVATTGIAFGHHNQIVSEAGGAVILESSLVKVDELIHISEMMRTVALQSALGGMGLAVAGMILAAFGLIGPVAGALLQEGIDLLAILNALRLTFKSNIDVHV